MPDDAENEPQADPDEHPTLTVGDAAVSNSRGQLGSDPAAGGAKSSVDSGRPLHQDPSIRDLARAGQMPSALQLVALVLAMALVAGVSALSTMTTNHVVILPGTVEGLKSIEITGSTSPRLYETGNIELVTVRTGRATYADRFYSLLHDEVDIVPLEQTRPSGVSETDSQKRDEQLMVQSKAAAEYAAFKWLGYPVSIDGGGAKVDDVSTDTAATGRILVDDVIVAIDGTRIHLINDIGDALAGRSPGEIAAVSVIRSGITTEIEVPISASREVPPRNILGVTVRNTSVNLITPFETRIPTANITGPSAGLAFGLEIVDLLTPGDLTGGNDVVATGVLAPSGAVGSVGGVKQKATAVERSGAKYFIVPRRNISEAREGAPSIEIVPVSDIGEAVAFLERLSGRAVERQAS